MRTVCSSSRHRQGMGTGCTSFDRKGIVLTRAQDPSAGLQGHHTSLAIEVGDGAMINALAHPSDASQLTGEDVWVGWKPETATVIPDRHAGN